MCGANLEFPNMERDSFILTFPRPHPAGLRMNPSGLLTASITLYVNLSVSVFIVSHTLSPILFKTYITHPNPNIMNLK